METEQITIVNEQRQPIGVRSRTEVHRHGLWHETFHCWFIEEVAGQRYLLFQRRSAYKTQFPNRFDITVAGHLQSTETPQDGVREIHEELGLPLAFTDLLPAGIIQNQLRYHDLMDNEFCHVYIYRLNIPIEDLKLQQEEVSGIIRVALQDFARLLRREAETVAGSGYLLNIDGTQQPIQLILQRNDFCPHSAHYYMTVIQTAEHIPI